MERPQNKHLRPWKPGQSGNPKGKPKRSLTTLLREAGEKGEVLGERLPEGMTVAEAFAQAAWGHAIKGNPSFASQILDRLEGKVPSVVQVQHEAIIEVEFGTPPSHQVPPADDDGTPDGVLDESG